MYASKHVHINNFFVNASTILIFSSDSTSHHYNMHVANKITIYAVTTSNFKAMFIKQKHKMITETCSILRGRAKITWVEPAEWLKQNATATNCQYSAWITVNCTYSVRHKIQTEYLNNNSLFTIHKIGISEIAITLNVKYCTMDFWRRSIAVYLTADLLEQRCCYSSHPGQKK